MLTIEWASPAIRYRLGVVLLVITSLAAFFLGFSRNHWRSADQVWYDGFQRHAESLIVGRMVKSRRDGILSHGGLLGRVDNGVEYQFTAYEQNLPFERYGEYASQVGCQAMVLALFDEWFDRPDPTLARYRMLGAFIMAVFMTSIVMWFYLELGLAAAVTVLVTALFSQWLTGFGRNLYWVIWALYLPMLTAAFLLFWVTRSPRDGAGWRSPYLWIGAVVSLAVFIKCLLNGYEYSTTTLVAMLVPYIYYAVLRRWKGRAFLTRVAGASFGALVAILFSFVILSLQIGTVRGGFAKGIEHITYSLAIRTVAGPEDTGELDYTPTDMGTYNVVDRYFNGVAIDAEHFLGIRFQIRFNLLIGVYALFTAVWFLITRFGRRKLPPDRRIAALVAATWFSLLAPLSWFIIFREHSYMHTHLNHITWHIPFTLFGFALCGVVGKEIARGLTRTSREDREQQIVPNRR